MTPINPELLFARDVCLPGKEQAALNELCRQIVELARRPTLSAVDNVVRWPLERRRLRPA
jgi:hypothetical protein